MTYIMNTLDILKEVLKLKQVELSIIKLGPNIHILLI